jgi:hypothetical protein
MEVNMMSTQTTEAVIISGPRKGTFVQFDEETLAALDLQALDAALDEIIAAFDGVLKEICTMKAELSELNTRLREPEVSHA